MSGRITPVRALQKRRLVVLSDSMINVEIEKIGNESNANVLRRFTKQVQLAKVLSIARNKQYSERKLSRFKKKARALNSMKRRENIQELIKLGKIVPRKYK